MPYKNNDYKNFIRSAQWQRLRAYHLQRHPLCVRCVKKGITTVASEVHHVTRCHDNPALQSTPRTWKACVHHAMPRLPMMTAAASPTPWTARAMLRTQSIQAGHVSISTSQPTQRGTGGENKILESLDQAEKESRFSPPGQDLGSWVSLGTDSSSLLMRAAVDLSSPVPWEKTFYGELPKPTRISHSIGHQV